MSKGTFINSSMNIKKIALILICGALSVACTEDAQEPINMNENPKEDPKEDPKDDPKEDPDDDKDEGTALPDNLNDLEAYQVLKNYVNYDVSPDFKLGVALQSTEYVKKGIVYNTANENFIEMTPGNQMKYNTIVANDGTMNFSKVTDFIAAAKAADMTIYGHTLCWHSQQTASYLNGLIEALDKPSLDNATWVEQLTGGDFENGSDNSIQKGNSAVYEIVEQSDGNHILTLENTEVRANVWNAQLLFVIPDDKEAMRAGQTYRLSMKVKSDNGSEFNPVRFMEYVGKYMANATPTTIATTTQWSDVTVDFVIPAEADNARVLGLCFGTVVDKFYFDDCSLSKAELSTDAGGEDEEPYEERKRKVIASAMERWIKAMMEACDGYVTTWDVVNEPMDDGNPYALKNGEWDKGHNKFYWQDHLGKDYVRYAVKYARQYGGDDLVLFVNDYNLEAAYNGNAKCKGLIEMIKYWESDGVTRIDGIGTQMHINLSLDPYYQSKVEDCVVSMFELLAATGKKIKISELDMGIASANSVIKTVNVTEEQHRKMADFYQFIVTKYFEIIPPAQQYGITQWCMTDSAEGSTWRAGEPTGLWDETYNRKLTYAGFARGLFSAK